MWPLQRSPRHFLSLFWRGKILFNSTTSLLVYYHYTFPVFRMAPSEWQSSHPCASEPDELENNFNLKNSLWLVLGSLMQQGSDVLPV